jgi:nitrate reductase (NAD(P)H)
VRGFVELLVKVYFDNAAGVPGGQMSQALDRLAIGATVEFKGPVGRFEYVGRGVCRVGGVERAVSDFVMVAGGSGITPIWQVVRAVLEDDNDGTHCVVLDGNRTEEDILCRKELDGLVKGREHRCRLLHTLTKASGAWNGERGRIGRALLEREIGHLKRGEKRKALVLICGPDAMEKSVHKALNEMGWTDDELIFF